jgi:crotonobetainyl-CoA:carnitine CoA-transferase CaiB-like acyl-CoA transferase
MPAKLKPLAGVNVVEMGSVVLAPYAAQVLADLGANVIKVEPVTGDGTRPSGTAGPGGMGSLFLNCNRGKRSLAVDLKRPEGLCILKRLLERSDVLLHNMRSEAAARLGLDFAQVHEMNPRLVYCSAYGYGAAGRYSPRPAYDDIIQAASGVAAMKGRIDGKPAYAPTILADKTTALFAVIGIQAALAKRAQTGEGEELEVAMFETMVNFVSVEHLGGCTFDPPRGRSGYQRLLTDFRRPHRTRDGYMAVLPYNAKQWESFFTAAGRGDLLRDPRFADDAARSANIGALYEQVAAMLPQRSNAEWEVLLLEFDIPHSRVNDFEDLVEEPHLTDVCFWHRYEHATEGTLLAPSFPVRIGGSTGDATPALSVPRLGEHSREILHELGYGIAAVDALRDAGIVNSV